MKMKGLGTSKKIRNVRLALRELRKFSVNKNLLKKETVCLLRISSS